MLPPMPQSKLKRSYDDVYSVKDDDGAETRIEVYWSCSC